MAELLHSLIEQRTSVIQQKNLLIQTTFQGDTQIAAEPFWLGQALANLLDNAISFTPSGQQIRLETQASATHLVLSVHNQGSAIPDYAIAHIFERYYSLPRPDTGQKSTGLGLTLVKEVLDKHQAHIHISNSPQGVLVQVSLLRSSA